MNTLKLTISIVFLCCLVQSGIAQTNNSSDIKSPAVTTVEQPQPVNKEEMKVQEATKAKHEKKGVLLKPVNDEMQTIEGELIKSENNVLRITRIKHGEEKTELEQEKDTQPK